MQKNILIGVLVVAVIALGVILLIPKGQNNDLSLINSPSPEISPTPNISVASSPIPSPSIRSIPSQKIVETPLKNTFSMDEATKNWKLYTNNEYKIKLRYQTNIKINPP